MKDLIDFFIKVGEVKRAKQRGWLLRNVQKPTSIGAHGFREAIMAWVLAGSTPKELNVNRIIKIALLHDLCAGSAGDLTPYEPILQKNKGEITRNDFVDWVRLPKKEKELFFQKQRTRENKCLMDLIKKLPPAITKEMDALWEEYSEGLTREGRFVQQIDMLENFFQALEYWKEDEAFPIESWWQQMKELLSDPILVTFLSELDSKFYKKILLTRKGQKSESVDKVDKNERGISAHAIDPPL